MVDKGIEQLRDTVVALRLCGSNEFDECLRGLGERADRESLLRELERRQILTSYQTGQIEKGEIDGLVLGDYKLLYRNASGSFARVFRACHITDGSMVGLKILRQRWAKDPQTVAQFRREALMLKRFNHPNIVPIYDVDSQGDYHYFTMEFVEGGNLRDFINIRKKLSPEEATKCILELAQGLDYALSMGATHRDLKMTNVLMSVQGVAKLVDFGLAGDESISGSQAGDDVQRALEYATLEKGTGAPINDPRSDLFFLGGIYYELLTGSPPYPRTRDREERKQFSRYANVRPVSELNPELPRCVTDVVDRLMRVNPNERFQKPAELIPVLQSVLAELGGEAVKDRPQQQESTQYSIMFVEKRTKHQNMLRDYLTRHGFRVMVSADADRAVARIRTPNAPDCLVLMGDSIGAEKLAELYHYAVRESRGTKCSVLAVMPSREEMKPIDESDETHCAVLRQPLTLRRMREAICQLMGIEAGASTAEE